MVPAGDGDGDGKRQHAPADRYVIEVRQAFGNKLQQEFPGAEENGETGDAAQQEEQQALGEELADEARSLRLPMPGEPRSRVLARWRGKQQIGDVDATDQQDQAYRAEQQNERLANVADKSFAERNQVDGPRASAADNPPDIAFSAMQPGHRGVPARPQARDQA